MPIGIRRSNPPLPVLLSPIQHRGPKRAYVIGGLLVYGVTAYTFYYWNVVNKQPKNVELPDQDEDVSSIYDCTARSFDNCVTWSEFLGGVNGQRRYLAQQATGQVLEVSVGTGRNSGYYNLDYTWSDYFKNVQHVALQKKKAAQLAKRELEAKKASSGSIADKLQVNSQPIPEVGNDVPTVSPWVESRSKATEPTYAERKKKTTQVSSLTFVDLSAPMIEEARRKFERKYPGYSPVQFLTQSALDPLPPSSITNLALRQGGYDYVLQSMGLCSTPEPVQLLRHLGELAHPDRGRILLLEHGRGHWGWMNDYLDSTAPRHAKKHGCWYNRDIGKLVEESGLVVERCKRKHFGTLWIIEARPRKEADEKQKVMANVGLLASKQQPTVEVSSQENQENGDILEAKPKGPGWTSRAWSSVKTLTGMDSLKVEDPGRGEDSSKKDD